MNKKECELKNTLLEIRENNWQIPSTIEPYELSKIMLQNIGSTDPVLRDELILELLLKVIEQDLITNAQMKELLDECLSESHLFCGLGESEGESVFNRTFTLLIIEAIMEANNRSNPSFLSKSEIFHVHNILLDYSKREKDLRGYVEGNGWAHSTAHTADALNSIVHAKEIGRKEMLELMELIRYKICDETYTYINNEEERLITTFTNIYERKLVSMEEIITWLNSFLDVKAREVYPNLEHLRQNRKLFFRGLAYRARKLSYEEQIIQAIDQILDSYECR